MHTRTRERSGALRYIYCLVVFTEQGAGRLSSADKIESTKATVRTRMYV